MSHKTIGKRKVISLENKMLILDHLSAGEGATSVGKLFGLNESTIRSIKKNEGAIRMSLASGTNLIINSSSYSRDFIKEQMERALVLWIKNKSNNKLPIDGKIIKQTAIRIYTQIKNGTSKNSSELSKKFQFSASTGWMTGFLKRHARHNIKIKRETELKKKSTAKAFSRKLAKIIKDGKYTPDQVWNADEINLFWKRMPSRTHLAKAQKTTSCIKEANDRVTLLFCSNASGNCILTPLMVSAVVNPRSMKSTDIKNIPVNWMVNQKAWMTPAIFKEWFHTCFVPDVEGYMKVKGLEFKVLLILDDAPCHPILEHPNVQIIFLPSNITSLIQPLEQGITATFQTYYIQRTFQHILYKLYSVNNVLTAIDVWKRFSIIDCLKQVGLALKELKPAALNACWKKIWPKCVQRNNTIPSDTTEFRTIIKMAHAIGGEGFDDLSFEDINGLLKDNPIDEDAILESRQEFPIPDELSENEEDPTIELTVDLLKEGLELGQKISNHFGKHDPDVTRVKMFQHGVELLTSSYWELYKAKTQERKQQLITEFLRK